MPGKGVQLLPVGQIPQQQQVYGFLKAEAPLLLRMGHQVIDLIAPVDQLAGNGVDLPFVDHIAVYVADLGDPGNDAGAVAAAQTTLHVEFLVQLGIDPGAGDQLVTQGLEIHHIFVLLIHGIPPFCTGGTHRDSLSAGLAFIGVCGFYTLAYTYILLYYSLDCLSMGHSMKCR